MKTFSRWCCHRYVGGGAVAVSAQADAAAAPTYRCKVRHYHSNVVACRRRGGTFAASVDVVVVVLLLLLLLMLLSWLSPLLLSAEIDATVSSFAIVLNDMRHCLWCHLISLYLHLRCHCPWQFEDCGDRCIRFDVINIAIIDNFPAPLSQDKNVGFSVALFA